MHMVNYILDLAHRLLEANFVSGAMEELKQ